jgi:hypothetical protein
MGNRIFIALVLLLWATTMSWLMVAKILPPFFSGEPPKHGSLQQTDPVCWEIEWNGRPVGYAVRQAVAGAMSSTEVLSRVLLNDIPLREMAPQWMSSVVEGLGHIRLDSRTRLTLDSFSNLIYFDTKVQLNDLPLVAKVNGRVVGPNLVLTFVTGGVSQEARFPLPGSSMMDGELIPDSKLLQVYVGRKWQTEMFSPFRPPGDSLELLQAEVVSEETIVVDGASVRAKRIDYRTMSGAGVASGQTLRASAWVTDEGEVVRHDVCLMNTKLRFERRDSPAMVAKARDLLDLGTVATMVAPRKSP